jgi:hypothetical protein
MISEENKTIWEYVKDNHKKLDACPIHNFIEDVSDPRSIWKRNICTKCGGILDNLHAHWYKKGLLHAKTEADQ